MVRDDKGGDCPIKSDNDNGENSRVMTEKGGDNKGRDALYSYSDRILVGMTRAAGAFTIVVTV